MSYGVTFGKNVLSLRVQRALSDASYRTESAFLRLSTGSRLNSASDDAASLAIAETLKASTRIASTGKRNISDGISALSIANGALEQQSQILMRLSELAEQSANGTFSTSQRGALDNEYVELVDEFNRIAGATRFNGIDLLRSGVGSSPSHTTFQAGLDGSRNSAISLQGINTGFLSGILSANTGSWLGDKIELSEIYGQGNQVFRTTVRESNGTSHDIYVITEYAAPDEFYFHTYFKAEESDGSASSEVGQLVHGGQASFFFDPSTGKALPGQESVLIGVGFAGGGTFSSGDTATFRVDVSGLRISSIPAVFGGAPNLGTQTNLDFTGIENVERARSAMTVVRSRLDELGKLRGVIGAIESRLMVSSEILSIYRENGSAAESRIRDVDVASETAELIASQIKQESASKVLALANSQPKLLLTLLGDI